jgi:putative transposase
LLGLPRSTYYHRRRPTPPDDLELMRKIDQTYLAHPEFGSRQMARWFRRQGYGVNRKRIQRLMRLMGLEAIYQKPNTSRPNPEHRIYPYLLRNRAVTRPNQCWAMDICYLPIQGGFLYLCAVMDWSSRTVLAWGLSNTLDATFCVEAVQRAIDRYGVPEIFNTDQGCQFTSEEFTAPLLALKVKLSMDGKGRCLDNVFVERLWRTVKWDEVYRKSYCSQIDAHANLDRFFRFYNEERPHSSFPGDVTPMEVYRGEAALELSA